MSRIVIVSGAGISAGSGIPTYRSETDGLWNINNMEKICTKGNETSKESVDFYNTFYANMQSVHPNAIHNWMAKLQTTRDNVMLFTQNIDDLLEKAGCNNVHHIHGYINEKKCLDCGHIWSFTNNDNKSPITCPICNGNTKYNVVFYGDKGFYQEMLSTLLDLNPDDIFILIGTSNEAINVDLIVRPIKCIKIYINPVAEPTVKLSQYNHVFLEKAENVLPEITQLLEER
jgi:NAD-dependent deacetylase